MTRLIPLLLITPLLACASAQAKAPIELASLEVPPVPPRFIVPAPVAKPASAEPVVESAPPAQQVETPAKQGRPRQEPRTPEPKPEPAATTPPQAAPVAPIAPLRINGTIEGPEADRQVREILTRAGKLLDNVERQQLSDSRKAEYDGATAFIKQAEDSLKAGRWELARAAASRAEELARLLVGRE